MYTACCVLCVCVCVCVCVHRVPQGHFKIVLATNVAETSITIDDVTFVIDTGRAKEMQHDSERGILRLQEQWVSQVRYTHTHTHTHMHACTHTHTHATRRACAYVCACTSMAIAW